MYDQLQAIEDRYEELGELLSDPAVISDTKRFMQLSKEEANTRETVEVYRRYKEVVEGIKDTEELLGENLDAEMAEMAKEELSDLKKEKMFLKTASKSYYYQKIPMMTKTLSWKFAGLRVEMKRHYLLEISLICIRNMRKHKVGKSK
ncbi:Peptide chain release factor 1 [Enterococcus sp. HSIEG1]|nr:Peptide chain release factor 1 [Enterococcus sp. HSIEG1]